MAVIGVCSLSGCGSSAKKTEEEQVTIGVVTKSKSSEYWLSVCDGMEDAAEKYHADVVILSPDSETEEEVQKNMIRDLLKTDIQAMAVSPIDSYECEDYLNFAREKGISVYACDTPIEDSEIPYIGIDNEKLGYELGEQLAKALDHKGKIGVIAGDFKQLDTGCVLPDLKNIWKKSLGSPLKWFGTDTAICGFPRRMWMRSW